MVVVYVVAVLGGLALVAVGLWVLVRLRGKGKSRSNGRVMASETGSSTSYTKPKGIHGTSRNLSRAGSWGQMPQSAASVESSEELSRRDSKRARNRGSLAAISWAGRSKPLVEPRHQRVPSPKDTSSTHDEEQKADLQPQAGPVSPRGASPARQLPPSAGRAASDASPPHRKPPSCSGSGSEHFGGEMSACEA